MLMIPSQFKLNAPWRKLNERYIKDLSLLLKGQKNGAEADDEWRWHC